MGGNQGIENMNMRTEKSSRNVRNRLKREVGAAALLLAGSSFVAAAPDYDDAVGELQQRWDVLEDYCMGCHNFEDYAGGIDLSLFRPQDVVEEAETFELVLRKLRNSVMPPPSQDQPGVDQRWQLIGSIENTLDAWASEHPHPGRVGLHRLNRNEYVNAVRELTGVELDAEMALPRDDSSEGFDNIASVLRVSPSYIDQYVNTARQVSELAIGSPDPLSVPVFLPAEGPGHRHVDGLPLGTRGGLSVDYVFPVDGEYTLTIPPMATAGYVGGTEYEHRVVIWVDGEKVFEDTIGGGEDFRRLDQEQAPAVADINGRFANIPITVTSGEHTISAAFVARSFAESDGWLSAIGANTGMDQIARMRGIEVRGPYSTSGIIDTPSRRKVMICEPAEASQEEACARQIFSNMARRAFRRPVGDTDIAPAMHFFDEGRELGGFDNGIKYGMTAILASPQFLYRVESAPEDAEPGESAPISDLELASRLSFFLWSAPPDDELIELADAGRLGNERVLREQVERMLRDPRGQALVENFTFQWLRLRDLEGVDPDPDIYPDFRDSLVPAFRTEVSMLVQDIVDSDRSILELMRADYTYLNEELALHYGIDDVRGDRFRRVELEQEERFGLLGKGGVQMITSYANRTTPVIRGAYIMENFLGVPPAAPPPDVEAFPETPEGARVAQTVRERLEVHRDNPACAGCHDVMDPLGLALENFNAIGQFRETDRLAGNVPIDASGRMADGTPIAGINDLRRQLLDRPEQFVQTFVEKLMIYSLGRAVEYHDMPTVRGIVDQAEEEDYSFSSIVMGIVSSDQFRKVTVPDQDNLQIGNR